jgi:4-hydroxy-tetrahydrodipicolinate reductase
MNIALIGYGKMGHEIEKIARTRGHNIVAIIDVNNADDFNSPAFKSADVAIEFSTPASALDNYQKCFDTNVAVVAGTTGWLEHMDEVKKACDENNQTFFYASNYSLGVNILFALNKFLARIMNNYPEYNVRMEEIHHIHKLDAPSGTAITLVEGIIGSIGRKEDWSLETEEKDTDLAIHCVREGEVPGIHEIIYESETDAISIRHESKNRKALALGAVIAAEFTKGKKGFLGMNDLLKF